MKYFFFLNTSHTAQNNCGWTLINCGHTYSQVDIRMHIHVNHVYLEKEAIIGIL